MDESYTRDRYCMAAVLVPVERARSLSDAVDEVVAEAARSYDGVERDALAAVTAHDVRVVLRRPPTSSPTSTGVVPRTARPTSERGKPTVSCGG